VANQQIARSLLRMHRRERPIDFTDRAGGIEIGLYRGDSTANPREMFGGVVSGRVMHHAPRALGVLRGCADYVPDGHVLGVAAGDRVGCR
jgi:hypothetical protein